MPVLFQLMVLIVMRCDGSWPLRNQERGSSDIVQRKSPDYVRLTGDGR